MKAQRGSRVIVKLFNLGARWGWVVDATFRPLYPPGKRFGIHCIAGWVGSKVGLDGCGKSRPHRGSITGLFSPWRVAVPTERSWPSFAINTPNNSYVLLNLCFKRKYILAVIYDRCFEFRAFWAVNNYEQRKTLVGVIALCIIKSSLSA